MEVVIRWRYSQFMERSSNRKTGLALLAVVALAVTPSVALAGSGDDQYCDPFGGCPGSGNNSGKSFNRGIGTLDSAGRTLTPQQLLARLKREAALHPGDRFGAAGRVLDAAGLSRLKAELPRS